MNNDNHINIDRDVDIALDVFLFLTSIPSPLAEFVYKRIVDEAYSIANAISFEKAKSQLIESISENINTMVEDINPICHFLGVGRYYKDVENSIMDKGALIKLLESKCSWQNLPCIDGLIQSYPCYSINITGTEWIADTKATLWNKLIELYDTKGKEYFSNSKTILVKNNCFLRLGYQTFFLNWLGNESVSDDDAIFYNWYCRGELMDVVLNTIYSCDNDLISRTLLAWLMNQCELHQCLASITQIRYDSLRQIFPQLSVQNFDYKGEKKKESIINPVFALESIPKSKNNSTPIDSNSMEKLYNKLKEMGYIDCAFTEFNSIFSSRCNKVRPIRWLKDVKELANFLLVLRGDNTSSRDYSERAAKVFIQKNYKPCKMNSIYQANREKSNMQLFKDIFNSAGILR